MSSQKTPNIGLHRWVKQDKVLTSEFNDNFTRIDTELIKKANTETVEQLRLRLQKVEENPLGDGNIDCGTF